MFSQGLIPLDLISRFSPLDLVTKFSQNLTMKFSH
jgi:hypothetical protein